MAVVTAEAGVRELQELVQTACESGEPLVITGGGSKSAAPPTDTGRVLETRALQGIVDYEPTELVITARAGTALDELQRELAAAGQMLGFEPPAWGKSATIGGTVACGLSGPRRPYAGALRDFVLGVRCLNGRGEDLHFGGRVMKNVAGYDIARLMAGARGTLGVLLEISFKVLPLPECEHTFCRRLPPAEAIDAMNRLATRPLPLSAAAWVDGVMYVRLSGTAAAVEAAGREAALEACADGDAFWSALREHQLDFFNTDDPVWRLSLPATTAMPTVTGDWAIDWGGAQRWLRSTEPAASVHHAAAAAGGYATLHRGPADLPALPDLPPALLKLHQRVKQAFDPAGILNPGLLYTGASC
ncbi:MAG: glycolate oxidase subunit GlcE [Gammaproteobacteria bacterium]|nr:glycolate oxidase subunit GlcE [Gammaproteobacteria bacterium]